MEETSMWKYNIWAMEIAACWKEKNITANGDDGCVARHGAPVCEETRLVAAEMLGKDRFLVSG